MWKSMPFERPTDYYDNRALRIDGEICELLKTRREVTNGNPGFPPLDYISQWAQEYGHYESQLHALFNLIMREDYYRPVLEPTGFRKIVQIFKSTIVDEKMYYIAYLRQYENATVVYLNIDWEEKSSNEYNPGLYELDIEGSKEYHARMQGGSGSSGQYSFNFIVDPPLPDDPQGIKMIFKKVKLPHEKNSTDVELVFKL